MVVTKKAAAAFLKPSYIELGCSKDLTINPSSYLADSLILLFSDKTML